MRNSHTFPVYNATYAAFSPQPLAEKVRARKKARTGSEIHPVPVRAVIVYCAILAENLFFAKTVIVYGTVCPYLQKSMSLIKAKGMTPLG